jgi:hypothetical protein
MAVWGLPSESASAVLTVVLKLIQSECVVKRLVTEPRCGVSRGCSDRDLIG